MTLSMIGKGNNPVLKVQSLETQQMYALKKITRNELKHHVSDLQEIMVLAGINHPNIIKIIGFETKQIKGSLYVLYILMELMQRNLGEEINTRRSKLKYFSKEEIQQFIKDLINALVYLHDKGIAHRDLKPENILIGENNQLILTDFNDSFKRSEIKVSAKTIVGNKNKQKCLFLKKRIFYNIIRL